MDTDQDESVFSLLTKLCEKFTNEPSKLKDYRKKSYEILLGKRLPKLRRGILILFKLQFIIGINCFCRSKKFTKSTLQFILLAVYIVSRIWIERRC